MNLLEHTRALIAELNPAQARRYDFIHSPIRSWPPWAVQDFHIIVVALEKVRARALREAGDKSAPSPTLEDIAYDHSPRQ